MNGRKKRSVTWRRDSLAFAALALLAAASYFPAMLGGFVWDDIIVTASEAVRSWSGIWGIWFDPGGTYGGGSLAEAHYWPLLYTTFWLEHKLWGYDPTGYHAVNILLHFANTVLLWRLLERLAVPGAWAAAAVFAAHPLHAEPVAWIIARKDLLSGLFYLCAATMWLRFVEAPRPRSYAAALALFAAGMLCKSVTVTLPAALAILQWWKHGRITREDMLRLAPFFLVGAAMAAADTLFYRNIESVSLGYSAAERTLIAARALWFYAGKLLWPTELAVIYPHWDVNAADPLAWGYAAAALAVLGALWMLRRRVGRGPLACVLFFAAALSPVLGFIDYGYMQFSFVADRYQYVAGIGIITLFAGAGARGSLRLPAAAVRAVAAAFLAVLALLCAASWNHSGVFRDGLTLMNHIVSHNPEARGVQRDLGIWFLGKDDLGEAESWLRRAVKTDPGDAKAFLSLGKVLKKQERYEEAIERYRSATEIDPGSVKARTEMYDSLHLLKRHEEVVSGIERAFKLRPELEAHAALHYLLGLSLRKTGRNAEAARSLRRATEINPGFANAYANIAFPLYALDRHEEAASSVKRAFELQPEFKENPVLQRLLGLSLRETGRNEEAEKHLRRAREIRRGTPAREPGRNARGR